MGSVGLQGKHVYDPLGQVLGTWSREYVGWGVGSTRPLRHAGRVSRGGIIGVMNSMGVIMEGGSGWQALGSFIAGYAPGVSTFFASREVAESCFK